MTGTLLISNILQYNLLDRANAKVVIQAFSLHNCIAVSFEVAVKYWHSRSIVWTPSR